jgi:hypothetical protein
VVKKYKDPSDENSAFLPDEVFENDFKHGGLGYEADAFARTLKGKFNVMWLIDADTADGLLECERMPHDESLLMAEVCPTSFAIAMLLMKQVFDKIRAQGGYKYPKGLERVSL